MTLAEAAALLGLRAGASEQEILAAYQARAAVIAEGDVAAADTLTRARDALLASTRWQPAGEAALPASHLPVAPGETSPTVPQPLTGAGETAPTVPYPPAPDLGSSPQNVSGDSSPTVPYPPAAQPLAPPAPPSAPAPPTAPAPQAAFEPVTPPAVYPNASAAPAAPAGAHLPPAPPSGPYLPSAFPAAPYPAAPYPAAAMSQPAYPPAAGSAPPTNAYPPNAYPPHAYPPYAPPRRSLSTGAIIAWVLGGVGLVMVIVTIAIVAIVIGLARSAADGSFAVPSSSSEPWEDEDEGDVESYVIDGVLVEPLRGWNFELTSNRDCPSARVEVGFSGSAYGDSVDSQSEVVPLKKGVPYRFTIPDDASDFEYASIDDIVCDAT